MLVNIANANDEVKKVRKYMQKYKDEYSKQLACIVKLSKSDKHAFCTICLADISITHGGLNDVKKHIATIKDVSFVSLILPYFGASSPFFKLCPVDISESHLNLNCICYRIKLTSG